MKLATLSIFIFLIAFSVAGQRKEAAIKRIDQDVQIDGELDESFWKECKSLSGFKQNRPVAGNPATRKTSVKIAYDDAAIYVAAEMFDERDSMSLTLSQRDDFGNADWFGFVIDPYNAGTIGFAFLVTSAGVQVDELHQVGGIDNNWNAVWKSEVVVKQDRWIAEFKIPFSAIRFPTKEIQSWGINFARNIRRNREQSYWNFFDPKGINIISQLGLLNGIENIDSPLRLSLTPYVSGYAENYNGNNGYSVNGGLDVKYGLNEAFTVDVTLIPDFGQVQFDNQVLNLSPFEIRFNENRQFFIEGTELFNKQGIFFSRRVGGRPIDFGAGFNELDSNEIVLENPNTTQLLNATKLSGRTKKGTGIGVFNALTGITNATLLDTVNQQERLVQTDPFSNYNVFVIDQNLKNNSSIILTNTNVLREGETYDANVTGLGGNFYTKGQGYNAGGNFIVSQIYENGTVSLGRKINATVGKSSGNFLWRFNYDESNKSYNQNDLGFQLNNNKRDFFGRIDYNIFKPFWRFYRVNTSANISYGRLIDPNAFSDFQLNLSANGTFLNFMTAGVWLAGRPVKNHDWFEPRVAGRFYEADNNLGTGGFLSSDYSKPFALDARASYFKFNEPGRYSVSTNVSPRIRFSDQFLFIYNYSIDYNENDEGAALTRSFSVPIINDNPVFAKRDQLTIVNRISANYIFTNRMGLTFSLRHFWSKVTYNEFYELDELGRFAETTYLGEDDDGNSLHNNSFNAFTIDMVYRWVFAPGSELSFVWKNSIFNSSEIVDIDYLQNVRNLADLPATNSVSLRLLYYIDVWETKQKIVVKN